MRVTKTYVRVSHELIIWRSHELVHTQIVDTEARLDVCHECIYINVSRTYIWMSFTNSYTLRLWTRIHTHADCGHRCGLMCVTNAYVWMIHELTQTHRLWTQVWPNVCHECLCMNDTRTLTHTQIVDTEAWLDSPPAGTTFYMIVRDIFIWLILWVRDTFVCEIWGRDSIDWFRNPISRTNWDVRDMD